MKFNCSYSEIVDVDSVIESPRNPNKHGDKQIELLAKIINHQGQRAPLVVSKRSGFLVCGAGRLTAIKKLGWAQVAIDVQDFANEAIEYEHMIADNKISILAQHDDAMMIEELKLLDLDDFELLGMDDFELPVDPDEAKEAIEDDVPTDVETRCKPGDLWLLGEHRLLCGDSTNIQHVEKLMDGDKADMVFTDPPYGVDYHGSHVGLYRKGDNSNISKPRIKNDKNTDIYRDVFILLKQFCSGPGYVFCGAGKEKDVLNSMEDSNIDLISTLIWRKDNGSTALNANYKPVFEMFYYVLLGDKRLWNGPSNEWTVWDIKRNNKNEHHPTQKPIEICEKAISNHKARSVLDLFGGSGSTLIACEKTNRKCYMQELDPHYCDVIISRWEKYSGKEAVLSKDASQ